MSRIALSRRSKISAASSKTSEVDAGQEENRSRDRNGTGGEPLIEGDSGSSVQA